VGVVAVALAAGGASALALKLLAAGPAADQPGEQVGVALGAAAAVAVLVGLQQGLDLAEDGL
jgi:hypothetical protein